MQVHELGRDGAAGLAEMGHEGRDVSYPLGGDILLALAMRRHCVMLLP